MESILWDQSNNHMVHSVHYRDVMMGTMASQITSLTSVYATVYSGTDQRKHQSSVSLAFCEGNSLVIGEFPAPRASNAENVSIWWRHYEWLHYDIPPNWPIYPTAGCFVAVALPWYETPWRSYNVTAMFCLVLRMTTIPQCHRNICSTIRYTWNTQTHDHWVTLFMA